MNCHECQPLLSAYVDQSVRADDRVTVERHLRTCAQCRALADDFAAIRDAAGSLEPLVPPAHVWRQLSATAAAAQPPRVRFGWVGWRPLSATAMAVMIAASLWRVGTSLQPAATTSAPTQLARVDDANADSDPETHYTVAIATLEEVTRADRDVLDMETADAINAGMTVIDDAITESRAALHSEPQSESAQESLFAALRRKVALLQEMVALINEMRKGDQDSAARILSEIHR